MYPYSGIGTWATNFNADGKDLVYYSQLPSYRLFWYGNAAITDLVSVVMALALLYTALELLPAKELEKTRFYKVFPVETRAKLKHAPDTSHRYNIHTRTTH